SPEAAVRLSEINSLSPRKDSIADNSKKLTSEVNAGNGGATQNISSAPKKADGLSRHKVRYDLDSDKNMVMHLVDAESNEIIRQIPPEEQLKIAKAIEKILDESAQKKESPGEPRVDTVV
ncbi:MAG: flagellar protein FlaG, partial [Nitrospinota bacterium]